MMPERAPFGIGDGDVGALRLAVAEAGRVGYNEAAVRERLGLEDITDLSWRLLPIYRDERLTRRDPLDLAIELFLLQGAMSRTEAARLLPEASFEVLLRNGVIERDEAGAVRARASLYPVGERLIFSDHAWPEPPQRIRTPVPYDQVMAVGRDSRRLALTTVRKEVGSALDLCTGSGVQALLAAAHAHRVVAVDINPRAIRCTQFNAQALGAGNVEAVEGDLYGPISGEPFDLITANPPFVASPVRELGFRDGGPSGEDVQKRIVEGLPDHLAAGGMAQIVTELGEREGEPITERLRTWLGAAPMDIYVLRLGSYSAGRYAAGHAEGDDFGALLDSTRAWAANLRAQGYARIISVVLSFQWSLPACGPPWERLDESRPPQRAAGNEILATFAAERLARHPDFRRKVEEYRLRRAGPIARFDASVLGGAVPLKATATRLGQPLSIEYELGNVERRILERLEERVSGPELLGIADEAMVVEAIRSLVRRRLVSLEAGRSGIMEEV